MNNRMTYEEKCYDFIDQSSYTTFRTEVYSLDDEEEMQNAYAELSALQNEVKMVKQSRQREEQIRIEKQKNPKIDKEDDTKSKETKKIQRTKV